MQKHKASVLLWGCFLLFLPIIAWIYYQRVGAFSFGDEWNNFIAGFFMQQGRALFSEIFHNHQVLPAYVSFSLQSLLHPVTLYKLVFFHRMFVMFFGFLFSALLVYRFRLRGLVFVVIFELTKYYVFGYLFLAEAILTYPLVYLFAVAWEKMKKKSIAEPEILFCTILSWFVVFTREPFIPIALLLLTILLWKERIHTTTSSIALFFILSLLTLLSIGGAMPQYIHQVFTFNLTVILSQQMQSYTNTLEQLFHATLYPVYILFEGKWNHFRLILISLSVAFFICITYLVIVQKRYKEGLFLVIALGLANIRNLPPGSMFFEAFHMIPWYGLFVFSVTSQGVNMYTTYKNKKLQYASFILFLLIGASIVLPQSFLWEKVQREELFTINYAHYYVQGEVIKALADTGDTLFADSWDYLLHWITKLDSPYPYAIYIFSMRGYKEYDGAREDMFQKNPPDFYYTYCTKGVYHSDLLPPYVDNIYLQLLRDGKPTCIYMKRTKAKNITLEQKKQIKAFNYTLPPE